MVEKSRNAGVGIPAVVMKLVKAPRLSSSSIYEVWIRSGAISPNGTHLLCSSEVYQSPGKFKRLWVLDVAHLAAVSQFDPREVTNEQYEVDGFTNDGKTVRIASNPVTAIKSITVWDLDATDLAKVVSKKIVVPDPPGFLGSRVGLAEFLWVRTRRGTLDEYDINSGQRVRSVKYEGQLGPVLLAPLQSSLLATGVQGVPGRTNWGAYLLLYTGESNSPIRSRVTSQCEFNDVRLSSDRRYATALCDGTMLNAVLDVYQTKKLEAVTFETDNLAILGTVPLNRRYDPASVALESSSEGIIEAIVDEPDRIRVVQVQARRAW